MSRYDLTDFEWRVIEPLLPNKPRGVPRVDDRRVLNGIFWVLRSGAPWRDLPERYGPRTTCYNRFVRWLRLRPRGSGYGMGYRRGVNDVINRSTPQA
jgi:transposase